MKELNDAEKLFLLDAFGFYLDMLKMHNATNPTKPRAYASDKELAGFVQRLYRKIIGGNFRKENQARIDAIEDMKDE